MQNESRGRPTDKDAETSNMPRPANTVEGTPDVTGQPGVESAIGRDRSQGELPHGAGASRRGGSEDISGSLPPEDADQGSRVGERGDPTGGSDETNLHT